MSSIHEILMSSPFSQTLSKSFDNFVGYTKVTHEKESVSIINKLSFIKEVLKFNFQLEKTVLDFETIAFKYEQQVDNAISFNDVRMVFHQFIEIRMHSWYKASLADFFAMLYHGILGKYCKIFYGDESEGIHNKLIQAIPDIVSSKPIILIHQIKLALRDNKIAYQKFKELDESEFLKWLKQDKLSIPLYELIHSYLKNWGFRCSGELMLTMNNYTDEPTKFIELLKQYESLPDSNPEEIIASKFEERKLIIKAFKRKIYAKNKLIFPISWLQIAILNLLIKLASKGISAREKVRLKQALIYYKFKQVLSKASQEFKKRKILENTDDVYFLRYQELSELFSSSMMLTENLNDRIVLLKSNFEKNRNLKFPDDFSSFLGEQPNLEKIKSKLFNQTNNDNLLKGLSVCGGIIKGHARVLRSVMEASKLKPGDILVTRQTDPGWVVVFPLISGLIVERGGMLSHGAIVSREFGIPAIVGIEDATEKIKDGDYILLNAENGTITFINE
jgi:pyruvate,water dikinase